MPQTPESSNHCTRVLENGYFANVQMAGKGKSSFCHGSLRRRSVVTCETGETNSGSSCLHHVSEGLQLPVNGHLLLLEPEQEEL